MSSTVASVAVGYCQCGCGHQTRIATATSAKDRTVKGEPRRYLKNHQPKGSPRESHPAWIGGRRVMASGYVQLRMPDHPRACNGYVLEHIVIAERALGRPLDSAHPVHHVDENRSNNANDNLVICQDEPYHKLLHRRLRALLACGNPNAHPCEYCGSYDRQDEMSHRSRSDGAPRSHHRECANDFNRNGRNRRLGRAPNPTRNLSQEIA